MVFQTPSHSIHPNLTAPIYPSLLFADGCYGIFPVVHTEFPFRFLLELHLSVFGLNSERFRFICWLFSIIGLTQLRQLELP
ncbi:hypothetical protein K1719_039665 [Acacia pycnantha]|nr:hypothetical protein K1719_039665 [Acacia pycnantha]